MAEQCALCGMPWNRHTDSTWQICGLEIPICLICGAEHAVSLQKEDAGILRMLARSPYLEEKGPILRKLEARRPAAASGRACSDCGAPMERKLKDFFLGEGRGGLAALVAGSYMVDLYACPQCGKVGLYTAGFRPKPEPAPEEEPQPPSAPEQGRWSRSRQKKPPWEK